MTSIYSDISQRCGGNIYIGVVGPVRTGKSTLIKRLMEQLVIPAISDPYRQQRARDELPQSGSGKTIMTAEPKFVPEEAVTISPDDTSTLSVRLIDSVGYMIPGAVGATEDGKDRMVTTPWYDHEVPMTQAAELGTKKVMDQHCTIGVVVTTDGTVTDIDRGDYVQAEERAIKDMQATGKPFVVVVNSQQPNAQSAQDLAKEIREKYNVNSVCLNCQTMDDEQIKQLLRQILYAFPVSELQFYLPKWFHALELDNTLKTTLYEAMRRSAEEISSISEAEPAISNICQLESVQNYSIRSIDLGRGVVCCELQFPEQLFYQVLGEKSGFEIQNDADLIQLLSELAKVKASYDKVESALEQVRATGYGVVMPSTDEMQLEMPEIVKKGGTYAVRLRASAPSIHMMRADIQAEISPMVGDEKQSQDLMQYLIGDSEGDTNKLWQSNIYGKTVYELVNDGFNTKLRRMPESARFKFKNALTRIVNEGSGGLICILL